jgi:putative salt-induced outer membrane protein YdiY
LERLKLLAAFLMVVTVASADDEVKLKNGDHLTGKVISLAGGKLLLETTHSGSLKIDWTQVISVKTDAPIKVKLSTGDILEGKVVPGQEGRLRIETPGAATPVEVDLAKVAAFNEAPAQWHGALSAAGKATDGNTHNRSFLISGEGTRETEMDLFLIRAIFRYGQQSGTLTERNAYGIGKYNYKFTPRFYVYVSEELLGDTFKDLSLESISSIGVGYEFLKEKAIDFSAEAGFAYFSNDFRVAPDESHAGARVAAKLRVALPLGLEFKDPFTIYPNFEHSQDYQLRNEATLGTALGSGWAALGGVITEFDNRPSPGLKKQDDTYFVGLGYTF